VTSALRVGFFGRLGSGNLGNDASLEAVLAHVRCEHPRATLDAMCAGPERLTARYDIPATQMHWFHKPPPPRWRPVAVALSAVRVAAGFLVDAWRTALWVYRHDVVIVPGMGILEANLVIRPWQEPYSMFLLAAFGRLCRTKVAMVGVGASPIPQWASRWLLTSAVRLVYYLSYRDEYSRQVMLEMGVERKQDPVFPDLVFSLPTPSGPSGSRSSVAVGVMAYWGSINDRVKRQAIHDTYIQRMKEFVRWLLETGHEVRLLIGDDDDEPEAREILADARVNWRGAGSPPVDYRPVSSTTALMDLIASVETVVATRFHNVLVALACARPTIAIAYGNKHRALMAEMGVEEFCQDITELDVERLKEQFLHLQTDSERIAATLTARARSHRERLDHQFADLTTTLFPASPVAKPQGVANDTHTLDSPMRRI
jgi:polysaccharide pyruvyl transferase WcaK-like protein